MQTAKERTSTSDCKVVCVKVCVMCYVCVGLLLHACVSVRVHTNNMNNRSCASGKRGNVYAYLVRRFSFRLSSYKTYGVCVCMHVHVKGLVCFRCMVRKYACTRM